MHEIHPVSEARGDLTANQVELAWPTRYPLSNEIIADRYKEFVAIYITMIESDHRITCSSISIRNTQANIVLKRVYQSLGNIMRTLKINNT